MLTTNSETVSVPSVTKTFKRQKGLGRINKAVEVAMKTILSLGHSKKRFKRSYEDGSATYICQCGASAVVILSETRGVVHSSGSALEVSCTDHRQGGL